MPPLTTESIEQHFQRIEHHILFGEPNNTSDFYYGKPTTQEWQGIEFKWQAQSLKSGGKLKRNKTYGNIHYSYNGTELTREEAMAEVAKPTALRQALLEAGTSSEELATVSAYSVSQKGAYSMPYLVDKAESVFPMSVLRTLGPEIIREVREAGKCLAFDIPTASAFHMLRATEGVLHQYYLAICKPASKGKLDNWGAYISALYKLVDDKDTTTKADGQCILDVETKTHVKRVLALLQQVKDEDRNQIMHLEIVLNDDEAFVLFEITKGAIMAMAEKMPALSTREVAPAKRRTRRKK